MYILAFSIALIISLIGILLSLKYFPKFGIVDRMESHSTHKKIGVRGGGLAISIAFFITITIFVPDLIKYWGVFLASIIIVGINFWDDVKNISRYFRLAMEVLAAFIVIFSGIGIETITSPFGGFFDLQVGTFSLYGVEISPVADFFLILWVVGLMNAVNWLDGLNGLAGGISGISSIVLFVLSLLPFVNQPEMAIFAIILFGSILGFLPFNFYDGRIKLGDTGAKFLGFMLAITAVLNKGKVATFFLVLGVPILDFLWVFFRRIFIDKKSPFHGDKSHFHHRLLKANFTEKQTVIIMWGISLLFGLVALLLDNALQKLVALIVMLLSLSVLNLWIVRKGSDSKK